MDIFAKKNEELIRVHSQDTERVDKFKANIWELRYQFQCILKLLDSERSAVSTAEKQHKLLLQAYHSLYGEHVSLKETSVQVMNRWLTTHDKLEVHKEEVNFYAQIYKHMYM